MANILLDVDYVNGLKAKIKTLEAEVADVNNSCFGSQTSRILNASKAIEELKHRTGAQWRRNQELEAEVARQKEIVLRQTKLNTEVIGERDRLREALQEIERVCISPIAVETLVKQALKGG